MPAVAAIPSTGEVSLDTVRNTFGIKGSGLGYFGAGPTTSTHLYNRYVPASVAVDIGSYYGLDPYGGTIPSSGTISLSQFRGAKPTAKFYCGAEVTSSTGAKRFGYGDAFFQGYDSTHGVTYTEGSRFYYPETNTTSASLGSISYRNLLSTGTNNLWLTGVQCQCTYDAAGTGALSSTSGVVGFYLFFESSLGNNTWISTVDARFTNVYVKIGSNATLSLPFSSKSFSTTYNPTEGYFPASSAIPSWHSPPHFRWFSHANVLPLYNQMKAAYYSGANPACYIWFD